MTDTTEPSPPPTEPADVVEAWKDLVLYVDDRGNIIETNGTRFDLLEQPPRPGEPFWEPLGLGTATLKETVGQYPPFKIHEVDGGGGINFLLRIIPMPASLAPGEGFVVLVTDNRPMEALYESYEERLEDNISAWSDSITLFNALFDSALDAIFLVDDAGTVLAANEAAQKHHAKSEQRLTGNPMQTVLGNRYRTLVRNAMHALRDKELWSENVVAIDGDGDAFPAEATLRRINFSDYSLYQLILRDLTAHVELAEDLQETQAEVREKDIALRQVLDSVEANRKRMREQLTSQVKKQMLPALERIATAEDQEVRDGYKTVIEDQLTDLAGDTSGSRFDPELLRLSPREMEVCRLIQLGRTGKEIAQLLNMSFETVQTHRKNIRRKLNLRGKKASLFNYLRTKPSLT